MNCEHCGKISTSIKRMEFCDHTLFHHTCSYADYCLECRIIIQFVIEQYGILTEKLKKEIDGFSMTITNEMRLNYK